MGYCWCCRDVAILVVWVVFVFFAILGLSFVPILDNAIHVAGQQLPSGPAYIVFSFLATFHSILGNIGSSPTIIAVGQYYYDPKIASTAGAYTEGGVGMVRRYDVLSKLAGMKVGETLIRYFHEAVKGASHDPYLAKDEGQILGTDLSTWELGELFIPTSLRPVLLSLNTGGRRHSARRHLLADALHALGQHPPTIPDFVAPPGVEPGELFYGKVYTLTYSFTLTHIHTRTHSLTHTATYIHTLNTLTFRSGSSAAAASIASSRRRKSMNAWVFSSTDISSVWT